MQAARREFRSGPVAEHDRTIEYHSPQLTTIMTVDDYHHQRPSDPADPGGQNNCVISCHYSPLVISPERGFFFTASHKRHLTFNTCYGHPESKEHNGCEL